MKVEKRDIPQPQHFQPYELVIRVENRVESDVVMRALTHYLRVHADSNHGPAGENVLSPIVNVLTA